MTSLLALATSPAFAGGVELSNQSMAILFERGNYLEFGASTTRPSVSGVANAALGGASSGNMTESFWTLDLRLKGQITEQLSYALIIDQPIGTDVSYPLGTGYPIAGSTGSISSTSFTGVMRYAFDGGFSVYGGLRAVRTSGSVSLPAAEGYTMQTNTDTAYGYVVGVAYERPEIAARISLTYHSAVKHTFDVTEFGAPAAPFSTTIPESVNLEFQTGIMEDTLLFGGIRWVRWSEFSTSRLSPTRQPLSPVDRWSITPSRPSPTRSAWVDDLPRTGRVLSASDMSARAVGFPVIWARPTGLQRSAWGRPIQWTISRSAAACSIAGSVRPAHRLGAWPIISRVTRPGRQGCASATVSEQSTTLHMAPPDMLAGPVSCWLDPSLPLG